MKILILLLVSPAIFAQRYRKHMNSNDEPFLPIHPVYPYNPKLTKRGFDKETATVLRPELYAPRTDAADSYTASFAGNPKDSYFPGYGSPPQNSAASYSPYSSYYGNDPYGVYSNPYSGSPYSANPYVSGAHSSSSYPGYFHQSSYHYPDYYNQPYPYSFPPSDHFGPPGTPWNENSNSNSNSNREYSPAKSERPKASKPKIKESSNSTSNGSGNHYVDGNNLITQNSKDLVTQSNAHKTSNPYNQPGQITDPIFENIPLPPPTYKVISVGGQPVGPNYPLPSHYARAQLLEQVAAVKSLAKSLGHVFPHQITGPQVSSQGIPSYLPYSGTASTTTTTTSGHRNLIGKLNQDAQYYSDNLNVPVKSVEAHIYGSEDRDLPDKEPSNQFVTANNQDSIGKLNDPQIYSASLQNNRQNNPQAEYAIGQADKIVETFAQSPSSLIKIPSKYQSLPYVQKPGTRVTFQRSQSAYIPPVKNSPILEEADPSSVVSYDQGSLSQRIPYRSESNYRPDQIPGLGAYQNVGQGMPQAYTYHQTNVLPLVPGSQQKTNLEDVNFGAKQGNKG